MSLAHEQETLPSLAKQSKWTWLRQYFPLIVVIVFGAFFPIPWVIQAAGVDLNDRRWGIPLSMTALWAGPALALLLLVVWWVFLSGFSWTTRLSGFMLVLAAGVGIWFCVDWDETELTTGDFGLKMTLRWKWQASKADSHNVSPFQGDSKPTVDPVSDDDFPSYRGARRDGVISFVKLQRNWDEHKPTILWRHTSPGGYSGVAVSGNLVVTMEQQGKKEVVACYDRKTGELRWSYAYDAYYKNIMGNGPRATPAIDKDAKLIYTIGATGEVVCLDLDGKRKWSKNILAMANAKWIEWGVTGSPLIVDNLVIAHAAADRKAPSGSALIAFDKKSGETVWQVGNRKAGYSSPQLVTLAKKLQILVFDGEGLVSYEPKTGKELWKYPWPTDMEMNSIQPVIVGDDRVFISSEMDNGCALLKIAQTGADSWKAEPVWANTNLAARYANPVTDGKYIYGLHNLDGEFRVLDVADGSVRPPGQRMGPGQMLLVGDLLLVVHGKTGDIHLLDASSPSCNQIAQFAAFEKERKTWNTPALAGDQLFIRNQYEIACVRLPTIGANSPAKPR